jgi:hypothetical protein
MGLLPWSLKRVVDGKACCAIWRILLVTSDDGKLLLYCLKIRNRRRVTSITRNICGQPWAIRVVRGALFALTSQVWIRKLQVASTIEQDSSYITTESFRCERTMLDMWYFGTTKGEHQFRGPIALLIPPSKRVSQLLLIKCIVLFFSWENLSSIAFLRLIHDRALLQYQYSSSYPDVFMCFALWYCQFLRNQTCWLLQLFHGESASFLFYIRYKNYFETLWFVIFF